MMSAETWAIARFTVLMALLATRSCLPPAIRDRVAARAQAFPGKTLLETIVSLPLVLPPVASGCCCCGCSAAAVPWARRSMRSAST
jgi:molybdate transport system permease protein